MQLLASWRDSLAIYKPSSFKLFFLVTMKALGDTYKVWLKYWWWLIGLFTYLQVWMIPVLSTMIFFVLGVLDFVGGMTDSFFWYRLLPLFTTYLALFLSIITLFLSARPSVALKKYSYFLGYTKHGVYLALWFLVLGCISNGWMLLGAHAGDVLFGAGSNASAIWHIAVSAKFMLFVLFFNLFFIQFFFDSSGSFGQFFASLWRGLKMFWFNLPFVLVMSLIFIGVYLILGFIIQWPIIYFYPQFMLPYLYIVSGLSQILIDLLLFMPFVVCVGTNFYVKRVHEQFGVYYKS